MLRKRMLADAAARGLPPPFADDEILPKNCPVPVAFKNNAQVPSA